jgi:predicted chitinase
MITESFAKIFEIEALENPFPGLRPFEFHENHLFFGREGQSQQLIVKLSANRFLAAVGASGSGKSSLVRAGMLPALFGGLMTGAGSAWRAVIMRPGNAPIRNLALALNSRDVFGAEDASNQKLTEIIDATLRRGRTGLVEAVRLADLPSAENLLVVVDQFEELFRVNQGTNDEQRENDKAAFVRLLLEAASQRVLPIYVVLTMRSDYLGDCSQFWGLPEAVSEGQYLIPRLSRDQLRDAIMGPIAVGGAEVAPRLVNRLLNDVGNDQDQLPILQHALMRTWDRWKQDGKPGEQHALGHYEHEDIGGMANALSNHADEAFNELGNQRSQNVAERVFKCLTEKGPDNREIRRPVTVQEICDAVQADEREVFAVIETFRRTGRSFLMPPADVPLNADSLIDISHESLIRGWQKLREWVEQEAQSATIYRRLAETAVRYERGDDLLLTGPSLRLAQKWREDNKPNLAWARRYHLNFQQTMAFLDESVRARLKAEDQEKERQRAEIERNQRELDQARSVAELEGKRAEAEKQRAEEQERRATAEQTLSKERQAQLLIQTQNTKRLKRLVTALGALCLIVFALAILAILAWRSAKDASSTAKIRANEAEEAKIQAEMAQAQAQRVASERDQLLAQLDAKNPINTTVTGTSPSLVQTGQNPNQNKPQAHTDASVVTSSIKAKALTGVNLQLIMPKISASKLQVYVSFLQQAMEEFEINSPLRQAAFLAQIAYESSELRFNEEIWRPTNAQQRYDPPGNLASALGNTEQGDGKRFKGRGPIPITGRANYKRYGDLLGIDLIANPDLAATPEVMFRICGLFWRLSKMNALADQGDLISITKKINGGLNGLEDRQRYYQRAKDVLDAK